MANAHRLIRGATVLMVAFALAACSGSGDSEDSQAPVSAVGLGAADGVDDETSESEDAEEENSDEDNEETTEADVDSPTDLTVAAPEEAPTEAGFEVLVEGTGETVGSGDFVLLAWEMSEYETGEVVESTENDFGGPVEIPMGLGSTPAAFENAIIGQKVGSRLQVVFPAQMEDLPPQFDADKAHLLAVQIVDIVSQESLPAPQDDDESSAPETTRPTTTTPDAPDPEPDPQPAAGLLVAADGPLAATPPAGAALPDKNTFEIVKGGSGAAIREGDTVQLDYVMVSWTTGEVVKSTQADFGGSQSLVLGDLEVPRFLEHAVFQQPVGTRLQVIYSPDLLDLPDGLNRDDAFVLAVDIVARG